MATPESVIEIGSTGVRLLVAEFDADRKQNILDRSEMPLPLGKNVFTNGVISQETQNQLIQILIRYREQLQGWGITPSETYCFATSAFRDAKNSDAIMDRIYVQTGFKVHIVDGIEENKLMYLAVSDCIKDQPVDFKNENTVILVVGGSTTEIMMMSEGKMAGVHSLRLGTVRIEEQIKNQTSSYADIQRFVQESINNTKGSLESELNIAKVKQFIALGQDVSLAALIIGRPISTFLWEINKQDFSDFIRDIQDYSVDECVARFKMSYSEAETFQVSLLIYNLFFGLTNAERIIVPETTIRNGYLLSKNSVKTTELQKEFDSQIIASARNLLRKFHGDEKHAECVRMIATNLYDALKDEIALDEHSRTLLEVASILHDIGSFIRYDNHNIHSSYVIKNSEIFGLSRNENKIISEIAKYHRGSSVPQDDESFHLMSRVDRLTILKLTAILRIADAMDRGHIQKFSDFTIKLEHNTLIINTKKSKNTVLEKIALTEKAGMFESVFGYKVLLM